MYSIVDFDIANVFTYTAMDSSGSIEKRCQVKILMHCLNSNLPEPNCPYFGRLFFSLGGLVENNS